MVSEPTRSGGLRSGGPRSGGLVKPAVTNVVVTNVAVTNEDVGPYGGAEGVELWRALCFRVWVGDLVFESSFPHIPLLHQISRVQT
ncbi:unnamed protein product [Cuscuta campestris]|uniref:Uncharacterized protein n=1 Tax=Cuscuta campestris TaxID=132261 RepID=A0A484K4D2_9ASTE|nr:unnamed protein product [Cuscuta campestris]